MRPAACLLPALLCLPLAALLVPHAAAQTEELGSNIDQARASRFGDIDEVTAIPQNVTPPSKPTGFRAKAGNRVSSRGAAKEALQTVNLRCDRN